MGRVCARVFGLLEERKGGKECEKEAAADDPRSFSSEQSQSQPCSLRHLMFALGTHRVQKVARPLLRYPRNLAEGKFPLTSLLLPLH